MTAAAVWLLCTAKLASTGDAVTLAFSAEEAVVRSADERVLAQAKMLERTTQGAGKNARTHLKFEGGELSFHDVYGKARSPRLKGLVPVTKLACKAPNSAK